MSERSTTTGDLLVALASFAATVCVFLMIALVVGILRMYEVELHTGDHERFSITGAFVTVAAFVLAVHAAVARWHGGRATLVLAIAFLGWFPPLVAIADYEMGELMIPGSTFVRVGAVSPNASTSLLPPIAVFAMALAPLAFALLAPLLARVARRGKVAGVAAIVVWLLGATLAFGGILRARRLPDPDSYIASLAPVATLTTGASVRLDGAEVFYSDKGLPCESYNCCHLETVDAYTHYITDPQLPCGGIAIVRDDSAQLWVVAEGEYGTALRMGTLDQVAVHPKTIHSRLAPPLGWVLGGVAGVLLAILPLAAAIFFQRLARRESDDAKSEMELRAAGASVTAIAIVAVACATLLMAGLHGI